MKKTIIILLCALITLLIFFAVFFLPIIGNSLYLSYLRFVKSDTGTVVIIVDGKEVTLDQSAIELSISDHESKSKIKNGKYTFGPGKYGWHKLLFAIPSNLYRGDTDIACEVKYFANSGNKNNFYINITITTVNESVFHVNGYINSRRDPYNFEDISKEIKKDDNLLQFYAPGP